VTLVSLVLGHRANLVLRTAKEELEDEVSFRTKELIEKEGLLRTTIENMPGALIVVDTDRKVVLANEAYSHFFGHDPDFVVAGRAIEDILQQESNRGILSGEGSQREILEDRIQSYFSKTPSVFEDRIADGHVVQITRTPSPDGMTISIITDITERKRIEDALHNSSEEFRNTFEQAAVGMAHFDADGHWIKVNSRLVEIVGYSAEELLNMTSTVPDLIG
jgi:PAS domain S-box-containing protein